jgi:hypothetical protein
MTGALPAPPEQTAPIIVVAGFGRCGSSLVMSMIEAMGIPIVGEAPAYELHTPSFRPEYWAEHYSGRAIKVLDPHIMRPPWGLKYKVIWLDRENGEQAKSHVKFLRWQGVNVPNFEHAQKQFVAKLLRRDRPKAVGFLTRLAGPGNAYCLTFEHLISFPTISAMRLGGLLYPGLSQERLAEIVQPAAELVRFRTVDCLPHMLEEELAGISSAPRPRIIWPATEEQWRRSLRSTQ